jgi:hypothetical protein
VSPKAPGSAGFRIQTVALIVLPFLLFVVFSELFLLRAPHIFIGFDGGYTLDLAIRQLRSGSDLHALNGDFMSALGHIYYPANFKLFPSFWLLSWMPRIGEAKAAVLAAILLELLFAAYLLARTAGLSRPLAVAASALACICLFPFQGVGYVFSLVPLVPHIGTSIAATLLMVVCFARFGQAPAREDWPWAAAFLALLAWCAFATITALVIAGCFLALAMAATCLFAASRQERMRKAALLGISAALFFGTGAASFLAGLLMDSVPSLFPGDLEDNVSRRHAVSIFFHSAAYGPTGPLLVVSAGLGAVWSLLNGSRPERIFAGVLLTFFALLGAAALAIYLTRTWRGPAPLYLEVVVFPLYAVFAVKLVSRLIGLIAGFAVRFLPAFRSAISAPTVFVAMLATAFPAWLVLTGSTANYGFTYPPAQSPVTDTLRKEIALRKGGEFKGRVVTLTGRSIPGAAGWIDLHGGDSTRAMAIGNEHRVTGLSYFQIPNLFPYGPTLSPGFYLLSKSFLARPGDKPMRNVTVLRNIDPRILGMMGVRYFITDAESDRPAALRLRTQGGGAESLLLYDIGKVNVGQFSPMVPLLAASIGDAVAKMSAPGFDPEESFVVHHPFTPPARLSRARGASLVYEEPALRFRAASEGWSVVLLPLDYSHCLEVESLAGASPQVFRANMALTGMLFEKLVDVRLLHRTGPISNAGCLLSDRKELLRITAAK